MTAEIDLVLNMRRLENEDDYWSIRNFLKKAFLLNGRYDRSWQAARLDYWRWHIMQNCLETNNIANVIFIWETADKHIKAVLTPENKGEAFLHIHPAYNAPRLIDRMISCAEENLCLIHEKGRKIYICAHSDDLLRKNMLLEKGYTKGDSPEYQRRRCLITSPVADAHIKKISGYEIRSLGDIRELPSRSWASWRAFHPEEPDSNYEGWEWYLNIQKMPLYRRDLDLIALSSEGDVSAFCTIWYDDTTRTAYFEPVGSVPEHQRKGLGKALIYEGMRRIQALGAVMATVGGYTTFANALYSKTFSQEYMLDEAWYKYL